MAHARRQELFDLPVAERIELVEELWDSIAADCEREGLPLPDEQREDLARRLREAEAEPTGGAPWEEVRERIRRRTE
jgi:putative addiction module component (TIGR02574 family)